MKLLERLKTRRGATQLGFTDVLTTLILLGVLFYAAYRQFSVYNRPSLPAASQQSSP